MAALRRVGSSVSTAGSSSFAPCIGIDAAAVPEQFPVGLRVLVVDDDVICLKILEQMLRRCLYIVTTCSQAIAALNILRERKGCFDVVLSDVHMPDMDGFKLLEHVGLEMDLPVIMMSADKSTSAVMKGVKHGACDYLIKPIREEELKNIWQHVLRKRCNENKEHDEYSGSFEDNDRLKRENDEVEYASSVNEAAESVMRSQKKRSSTKDEDDVEQETDDPSTSKKPRVVWSVELHQQFVCAVNQLGIDKAVPKRILELMNVPGLTRENVASHLQKYRLYLKRLCGVAQQSGFPNAFCGPLDSGVKLNPLGRFDIQALAASGQIPPQTLAALHAELFGRPATGLVSAADQPNILQQSLQNPNCISVEQGMEYGQPLVKCQSNLSKSFSQNVVSMEDTVAGFGAWPSTTIGATEPSIHCGVNLQNGKKLMNIVLRQQQKQQQSQPKKQQQLLQQSSVLEANCSINVQPSCLVVPSHSASFQAGNSPASVNQSCNRSVIHDYSLPSQSSNSRDVGSLPNRNVKAPPLVSRYPGTASVYPSMSSNSLNDETVKRPTQSSAMTFEALNKLCGHAPSSFDVHASYSDKAGELVDRGMLKSLGFVGKGTCIPSRFAVDDLELQSGNSAHELMYPENRVNKVKQEPATDILDGTREDVPMFQQFPANDLMSVFTE